MADRISLKCQACGDAENCNFYCVLTIDNCSDPDDLLCPVTGEEAEWYETESKPRTENWYLNEYKKYVTAEISRGSMPMKFQEWNQTVDKLAKELGQAVKDGDNS